MSRLVYSTLGQQHVSGDVLWTIIQTNHGEYRIKLGQYVKVSDIETEQEAFDILTRLLNQGHGT